MRDDRPIKVLLFLLYLVGYVLPAFSLVFWRVKPVYLTGSSSVWLIAGLWLAVFSLVSWQFLDGFLKKDASTMVLSLISIGGVSWTSESESMKLVLMHGIDSVQSLSIGMGLGNSNFDAGIVKEMAVQIPIGALALLASKVRAFEQRKTQSQTLPP